MAAYCPQLDSAWVMEQRAHYARLDTPTPTDELVKELVATGELDDPRTFDITTVCE